MKNWHHFLLIAGAAYVLFVVFDTWRAYQTSTGQASKWNVLARVINWRVQAAITGDSQPSGAGNDWSFATDYVKGGAN